MRKKGILVLLIVLLFIIFTSFYYSTSYPNKEEQNRINEKYSLHLPDVEWNYTQYEKDFLFYKESMVVLRNYYECQLFEDCDLITIISITENDSFIKLTLPFVNDGYKEMIEEDINWKNKDINVKIVQLNSGHAFGLEEDEYIPIYRITVEKENILYQFQFDLNECIYDIYNIDEKEVHKDELEVYLEFIEDILF